MTTKSHTQVPIDGFKLATMCKEALNCIDSWREEQIQAYVNARLQHTLSSRWDRFWRKVLQRPAPTYESVLADEKKFMSSGLDGLGSPLFYIQLSGGNQERVAKKLLAATAFGSPVYVGVDDLEVIEGLITSNKGGA